MVNWYNVKLLAATGLKTVISSVFGNFADKRELMAAIAEDDEFFDFSKTDGKVRDEIWFDYVADLGDGFNSTFTIASLLGKKRLILDGKETQRGELLIMGGDEVYPTPEMKEYNNRLKGPYVAASPWEDDEDVKLFAIPGNHDWYDGLTNFMRIFCQQRSLGNWITVQERSYFAIKLPHDYWILAVDTQLTSDIDAPQKKYFQNIARNHIKGGDKIILCTAEPTWVYQSWDPKGDMVDNVRYFIDNVLHGKYDDHYGRKDNKAKLVAVLTGDLHHYSRYEETEEGDSHTCQLITAGGGGAFTHPTHFLKDEIDFGTGDKAKLMPVRFPSKPQSFGLGFRNLVFPFYSISMMLFLGFFHLITSWSIESHPKVDIYFMNKVSGIENLGEYIFLVIRSIPHSPVVLLLNLILIFGLVLFTDNKTGKGDWNYVAGFIHGIVQVFNFYMLIWIFAKINLHYFPVEAHEAQSDIAAIGRIFLFSIEMIFIGGFLSAWIFGLYLFVSTMFLKNHPTEAFSSFRHSGFKNFLRIHIDREGNATIYPVGLKKVVKNWVNVGSKQEPKFKGDEPDPQLIESPIKLNI